MINLIEYINEEKRPKGYWNEETCREEAKKYKTRGDFKKGSNGAWNVARRNGWLDTYDWFEESKSAKKWNEETCREEAKKYKTRGQFAQAQNSAYEIARKNGWLDTYDWFDESKTKKKWNEETCREEALKYKTSTDFKEGSGRAYQVACKYGWIENYTWFQNKHVKNGYWNEETCREEAKKYTTRSAFQKGNVSAYTSARKNGWLDSYTWLKDERFDLYKDPIDCVYGYFFDELNAVYIGRTLSRRAKDRDREHIFCDRDAVAKFAKKHDIPVPKMKVIEKDLTITQGAEREGYWEKYYREKGWTTLNRTKTGSIGGLGKGKWDEKTCREEALKYKTLGQFQKGNGSAYNVALRNGWLDTYDWFDESKIVLMR